MPSACERGVPEARDGSTNGQSSNGQRGRRPSAATPESERPEGGFRLGDLRDRPLGRLLILLVLGLAIFLVARGCQREGTDVSQERAVEIATGAIDYTPDNVQVRFIRQGLQFEGQWVVALSLENADGSLFNTTVIQIDGSSGEILTIRRP